VSDPFKPITREQAADILSVSLSTLDTMIDSGALPAPRPLGGRRRLYWHPAVFYGHLGRKLMAGEPDIPQPVPKTDAPPSSAPADTAPAPAHPVEDPVEAAPQKKRKRESGRARARQAARMKKLNE
jgi:excisionase family DNA binding protein